MNGNEIPGITDRIVMCTSWVQIAYKILVPEVLKSFNGNEEK